MGFLTGSVTCVRFDVGGWLGEPGVDLQEVVSTLARFSFRTPLKGEQDAYPHYGWCGGRDEEDLSFAIEDAARGPFACFAMVVVNERIPPGAVRARARQDLAGMAAAGEKVTPAVRRQAVRDAKDALREEGRASGRYLAKSLVPVAYDSDRRRLWLHSHSHSAADGFARLVAHSGLGTAAPVGLSALDPPAGDPPEWLGEAEAAGAWGNLFAADVLARSMDSSVPLDQSCKWPSGDKVANLVCRRTLTVRCPKGEKGTDRFDHELPDRLPELQDALREGKLPTAIGLDLWADDFPDPVPFALVPHRLAVSGLRPPKGERLKSRAEADLVRLEAVRSLLDLIDGAVVSYARKHLD